MTSINYATREIQCKLVYYGPGLCGKTTNLQQIHAMLSEDRRGDMISLATTGERTLYFDFLPVSLAQIDDFTVKFALYTVPGQVQYNATRKLVLRGADGIVFVADSQWDLMRENVESLENLQQNLAEYDVQLAAIPHVMQFNKRDLPEIAPVSYMEYLLNPYGAPSFAATALTGDGVRATLYSLCRYVIRSVAHRHKVGAL